MQDNSACAYKQDKVLGLTSRIIVLVATSGIIEQVTRVCGYKQVWEVLDALIDRVQLSGQ